MIQNSKHAVRFGFGLFLLAFIASLTVQAQPVVLKIGVIDMLKVFNDSERMQQITKSVRDSVDAKKKELARQEEEIKNEIQTLQMQRELMPQETFEKQLNELRAKQAEFVQNLSNEEREVDNEQERLLRPFVQELRGIVEEVAKEQGYNLILKKEYVAYVDPSMDLTDLVLQRLNQ